MDLEDLPASFRPSGIRPEQRRRRRRPGRYAYGSGRVGKTPARRGDAHNSGLLPLRSYCRLRSVCKSWNESALNPCFCEICERIPPPAPFWVVFACGGPLLYDTTIHSSWHVASSFLSYECFTRESILEAAGSLLFYRNFDPQDPLMIVFNPISKHKRRLPAMLSMEHCYVMGIVLDKEMASYKVYAVDQSFRASARSPEVLKLQLFDSIRGRWEMSGSLLRDPEDPQND